MIKNKIKIDVMYIPKAVLSVDFPRFFFPSGHFPNVQFSNRQLPKPVLAAPLVPQPVLAAVLNLVAPASPSCP